MIALQLFNSILELWLKSLVLPGKMECKQMDRPLLFSRMQTFQTVLYALPCENFGHATCLEWESIRPSLELVKPVPDTVESLPLTASLRLRQSIPSSTRRSIIGFLVFSTGWGLCVDVLSSFLNSPSLTFYKPFSR